MAQKVLTWPHQFKLQNDFFFLNLFVVSIYSKRENFPLGLTNHPKFMLQDKTLT